MSMEVSRRLRSFLGALLYLAMAQVASAEEERYEIINAIYVSRSEAVRAEQRTEGVFTVADRSAGSINNCLCAITYNRSTGAVTKTHAECKAIALGEIKPAPGRYTFYGPGRSRPSTASGSPDFASIHQDSGKLRFCTYLERAPGRYTCVETPLKF